MATVVTDHAERGLTKQLEQFKGKPFLEAFLRACLNRVQELTDAVWEVVLIRGIDNSEGENLDDIGRIVGRPRLGYSDANYKIALRAQIRINRSSGTPEDVIAVATLSIPAGFTFTYEEAFPANIQILVNEAVTFDIMIFFDSLVRTKSGGVRLLLEYSEADPARWFLFSADDTEPDDTAHGMGDDLDDTIGGVLLDVLEG